MTADSNTHCDIVIVSYNSSIHLPACLKAVRANANDLERCEVFVVDNASTDDSAACARTSFPEATLIENAENLGYGAAINRALERSEAPFVLCMNPDVRLQSGAVRALLECMHRYGDAVAAAPKLTYPDGTFHAVCRRFPSVWRNFCHVSGLAARLPADSASRHWLSEAQHDRERDADMVSGACILFRRDYLERIGRFDENILLYEEEADVFLPTRILGGRAYYCPSADAVHEHGERKASDDAAHHRLRSKYYVFRKQTSVNVARLVYLIDWIVFSASGKSEQLELVKKAYKDSSGLHSHAEHGNE